METKDVQNGSISRNVQILFHLNCVKNKMISQNVKLLVNLGFPKISRTSGCMNGDQRMKDGMITQNIEILVDLG